MTPNEGCNANSCNTFTNDGSNQTDMRTQVSSYQLHATNHISEIQAACTTFTHAHAPRVSKGGAGGGLEKERDGEEGGGEVTTASLHSSPFEKNFNRDRWILPTSSTSTDAGR